MKYASHPRAGAIINSVGQPYHPPKVMTRLMFLDFIVLADYWRNHARFLWGKCRHYRMYILDLRGGCSGR